MAGNKEHILIAEDDAGLLAALAFILRGEGHEVDTAVDGLEALDRIADLRRDGRPIDLLITDIQMPRMNGLKLIQNITHEKNEFPIIVITGHGDKQMLVELLRLGCDDFLDKPFEPQDVHKKVQEVLERQRLRQKVHERTREDLLNQNTALAREASDYKRSFTSLRREIDAALGTYHNLISIDTTRLPAPVAYRFQARRDLGGDYLDVCPTEQGLDVVVADVAGHDLAASYQTVLIKAYFKENCRTRKSGQEFFNILNRDLSEGGRNERMVTAVFMRMDFAAMTAEVTTAGHPKVLRLNAGESVGRRVPGRGSVLGLQELASFASSTLPLNRGDRFYLYTDGVIGARAVDGPTGVRRTLGEDGLLDLLNEGAALPLDQQIERVWQGVLHYCRFKQSDDMLLFGVEVP
ncbi:MAG: PP2C family protein-serine/threonine phosphatase [Desulfovibrionaceae bacterium]